MEKKKKFSATQVAMLTKQRKKKKKRKAGQYMGSSAPELAHFQSLLMLSRWNEGEEPPDVYPIDLKT